ncbi:MAG TPA: hypothetical protein VM101_04010 [Flavitalea sp.]|nr:hypothetical protein [Flavitalea sp.]
MRPSPPIRQAEDHYLYNLLLRFLDALHLPDFVYGIIAFLLLYIQSSLINRVFIDQKMLPRPNYLPGMAYMLLSSLFVEWNYFSPPLIINTFLILMFYRMINLYNSNKPLGAIFNIGVMMGLVTLLYQPAFVYVLMIPFTLFIMRPFRVREWLTAFLGFTTPYYFLVLEPLFTNKWNWNFLVPSFTFDFPAMPSSIFITVSIILLVLPFISGGYFVQTNLNKMLIQIRKGWSLLLLFLIMSIFVILVNGGVNYVNWMFGLMPLAAFHAATYFYPNKSILPVVLHWITFAYAIYMGYWHVGM